MSDAQNQFNSIREMDDGCRYKGCRYKGLRFIPRKQYTTLGPKFYWPKETAATRRPKHLFHFRDLILEALDEILRVRWVLASETPYLNYFWDRFRVLPWSF